MNFRLLGAEREEEVNGDAVLLSLFSLPGPTVKKTKQKNPYSLQDVSNSFLDDISIFASDTLCESVSHGVP